MRFDFSLFPNKIKLTTHHRAENKYVQCVYNLTFRVLLFFFPFFCLLFGILCTILFSSKPICICMANIHFHFGFMCLPSLLIGFGSFPNVQSVPGNNYIPKEIHMNFVKDFDSQSVCQRRDSDILLHVRDVSHKEKCQEDIILLRERAHCCLRTKKYADSFEKCSLIYFTLFPVQCVCYPICCNSKYIENKVVYVTL